MEYENERLNEFEQYIKSKKVAIKGENIDTEIKVHSIN